MTKSGEHCDKLRNCTFCAISSFVTMFSESRLLQRCQKASICGKGLLNRRLLVHLKQTSFQKRSPHCFLFCISELIFLWGHGVFGTGSDVFGAFSADVFSKKFPAMLSILYIGINILPRSRGIWNRLGRPWCSPRTRRSWWTVQTSFTNIFPCYCLFCKSE